MGIEEVSAGRIGILQRDRLRDEFVAKMLDICGDVRFFALAQSGDTTTTKEKSRHAVDVTWSKDISTFDDQPNTLGEGYYWHFDGVDEEGDTPDLDRYSFGDGANDSAFSVIALINPDSISAESALIAKYEGSANREWLFSLSPSGNGYPRLTLYDESANTFIGREDQTAPTTGTWTLLSGTYDGAGLASGVKIYKDAAKVDDADVASGTYVGMENLAAVVSIAHDKGGGSVGQFYNGLSAFFLVTAKELNADEQWAIKTLVNWYYNLSL